MQKAELFGPSKCCILFTSFFYKAQAQIKLRQLMLVDEDTNFIMSSRAGASDKTCGIGAAHHSQSRSSISMLGLHFSFGKIKL
jgi:hypothetical protein